MRWDFQYYDTDADLLNRLHADLKQVYDSLADHESTTATGWLESGNKIKIRVCREDSGSLFVYAPGKRRRGYRYPGPSLYGLSWGFPGRLIGMTLNRPVVKSEAEVWTAGWTRVRDILIKSGLWPGILQSILQALEVGYDTVKANPEKYDHLLMNSPKIKSMYFGRYRNAQIKAALHDAMLNRRPYRDSDRAGYDVSVSYDPEHDRAWYSEEYRNCGNGHYYLALNSSQALFYEDD